MLGQKISFEMYPEMEPVFDDFIFALTHQGAFDAETIAKKGPRWKAAQTVLSGTYNLLKLRMSNPFFNLSNR